MKVLCIATLLLLSALKLIAIPKPYETTTDSFPSEDSIKANVSAIQRQDAIIALPAAKPPYAKVPLAGEKAYFGDKSDFVTEFTRRFMEKNSNTLTVVQNNSSMPFAVIDNVLEQKKMPKELKYLAVIESALNHNALSRAGALGPWQLMASTAQMMGLKTSRKKDERTDWGKSTEAATKYLEYLYSQLNDWLLVIAAYNSGPVPVQKAIDKTGSHSFWEIKEYLPKETQGHVLAFIATASIFEKLGKYIPLGSVPADYKIAKEKDEEIVVPSLPMPNISSKATEAKPANTHTPVASTPKPTAPTTNTPTSSPVSNSNVAVAPSNNALSASTTTEKNIVVSNIPKPIAVVKPQPKPIAVAPSFTEDELKNMVIIRLDQPVSFELLSMEFNIDKKTLVRWNPEYEAFEAHNYVTPYYKLRFPKDKSADFVMRKEALTKKSHDLYYKK